MDKFAKIPVWVAAVCFCETVGLCAYLGPGFVIAIVVVVLFFRLFALPAWTMAVFSGFEVVLLGSLDFRLFSVVTLFAVFSALLYKATCLVLKSAKILGAKLLGRGAKETGQYEGSDPAGLGRPYVWSGKPAESEHPD